MRNLLNFLIRYSTWFVFTFYVLVSFVLLFSSDAYHQSVWLTSANSVAGSLYGATNNVTGYFNLREINRQLQERNASLENEVLNLRTLLQNYEGVAGDSLFHKEADKRFGYTLASVLNNSVRHPRNYITIDAGQRQGVMPGMGVVDQNGIVGIVNVSGPNTARVISLLNRTQHFSVKIKDTSYVGSLAWRGEDPTVAYMEEVPRHAKFHPGDSVVTSGFSTTFPEGLPVGVIMSRVKTDDDNYYVFKIKLASDFKTLSTVRVIKDIYKNELDSLQTFDIKTDEQ